MAVNNKQSLGKAGEDFAAGLLQNHGHVIVARNWHGRYGELDIVSNEGSTLVISEVKTRRSQKFGAPQQAVTAAKQKRLSLAALEFMQAQGMADRNVRFDVIALIWNGNEFRVNWLKNAFEFNADNCWT